jgi:hypothetical protein
MSQIQKLRINHVANSEIKINHVANSEIKNHNDVVNSEIGNMLLVPDLFQSLKTEPEDFVHFFDKKDFLHVVVLRVKSSVVDPDTDPEPEFQLIRIRIQGFDDQKLKK